MDAAPTATPTPPAVGAGALNVPQFVVAELADVVTSLGYLLDDPCTPAQRLLLTESRDRLTRLVTDLGGAL